MRWKIIVLMLCTSLMWSAPALAQGPDSNPDTELNALEALTVDEEEDGTYIRIQGNQEATFSVFKLDEPPRLFVDLSNSKLAADDLDRDVYNGVISKVALVEFEDSFQEVARLVVGFEEPAHYDVRTEGNEIVVFVDGDGRQAQNGAVAATERELRQREAEAQQARQRLEEAEQRFEARAQQRQQDYQTAQSELDATRQQLEDAQNQLEEMRQQRQQASGEQAERLEASIAEQKKSARRAQQRVDERERQVEQMQQAIGQLEDERDEARQNYQEARQQAQQAQENERQARQRVDELEGRLGEMDTEVEEAESRISAQEQQLQQAQSRASELEEELAQARRNQDRQEDATDSAAQAQREIERRQERLEQAQRQARQAAQQLQEAKAERQEWQQARSDYQRQLEQAQQSARQAEAEKQELSDAVAERDAEIERLKENARTADPDAPRAAAVPVDPTTKNVIRAVRLETSDAGHSQIVVDLDRPGQFTTSQSDSAGRSVMVLNDVALPPELERTLSAETDGGAVRFVSSYEDDEGSVHMEADLRGDASEVIRQDGNRVVWEFAPVVAGDVGDHDVGQVAHRGERYGADRQPERPTDGESVTSAPPNYPRVVTNPARVNRVPGMGAQPITIDLRNADIENVLRLISAESGVNIIAGDDVGGAVTMKLQGVPMDEAFLTILQSLSLGYEIRGNVIRVAPQSVLNEEEEQRAEARARAQAVEPLEVFLLPINYASASDLTGQVDGLLSPRGSVSVDERTNTLIIKDLSNNLRSIRMLIETLDAQVPQVLIEARIVETNQNFDREVGIQWGGDFSMSQGSGNPTGLIFPNVLGLSGGATDGDAPVEGTSENPNYAVNLPATAGTGQGGALGLTMGSVGGAVNLNMRLSAMEDAGYAKIISAPRILTLDNREATISQGTSIPISVVSAAGVQTIFVDATLELTVTPHVTPDGNVRMSIEATKNEPDFQNTGARGDPTIIQNQAETELLVADGDTTVIGGIYTENTGESMSAVPFLHRIPILGFLFQNHSETENRSELLIFITPRIVNRAEALGIMSTGTIDGMPASEFD